eukprot:jgi/Mesvir1/6860/Mv09031-RA.1
MRNRGVVAACLLFLGASLSDSFSHAQHDHGDGVPCIHDAVLPDVEKTVRFKRVGSIVKAKPGEITLREASGGHLFRIHVIYQLDSITWHLASNPPRATLVRSFLKEKLFPSAVKVVQKVLRLRTPVEGPLLLERACIRIRETDPPECVAFSGNTCLEGTLNDTLFAGRRECRTQGNCVDIPDGEGAPGADLVLLVTAKHSLLCQSTPSLLAVALHCSQDLDTDRPTSGGINFCPDNLDANYGKGTTWTPTTVRVMYLLPRLDTCSTVVAPGTYALTCSPTTISSCLLQLRVDTHFAIWYVAHGATTSNMTQEWWMGQDDDISWLRQLNTAVHELVHVLGFSSSLFPYYRDPTGKPRNPRDVSGALIPGSDTNVVQRAGDGVSRLITPKVVEAAQSQLDCTTLTGAALENVGGPATASSHWEARLWNTELMMGTIARERVLSKLTLAALEDSGWYLPVYEHGSLLRFGYGKGCDFARLSCAPGPNLPAVFDGTYCDGEPKFTVFDGVSTEMPDLCTADDISVGSCTACESWGGVSACLFDGCSQVQGNSRRRCDDLRNVGSATNPNAPEFWGQRYSLSSRCFPDGEASWIKATTAGTIRRPPRGAGCYLRQCARSNDGTWRLQVRVGDNDWVSCVDRAVVNVSRGEFQSASIGPCPVAAEYCPFHSCPSECSQNGVCFDGACHCYVGYVGAVCDQRACTDVSCAPDGYCDPDSGLCKSHPAPSPPGNTMEDAYLIPALPFRFEGNTELFEDSYSLCDYATPGPDMVFKFTTRQATSITVSLCGSSFDTVLSIFFSPVSAPTCNDDYCGLQSQVFVQLLANETVYLFVDGFYNLSKGAFSIYVTEGDISISAPNFTYRERSFGAPSPAPAIAIGPGYIVTVVNSLFGRALYRVYAKNPWLLVKQSFLTQFHRSNTICRTGPFVGAPNALYDHLADRWLIMEVARNATGGHFLCLLASFTNVPYGLLYRGYTIALPGDPANVVISMMPEAYYFATSEGVPAVYALDRLTLVGARVGTLRPMIQREAPALPGLSLQGFMPAHLSGAPRVNGSCGFFIRPVDDELSETAEPYLFDYIEIWQFCPKFDNADSSSFSRVGVDDISGYNATICSTNQNLACFAQPGSATRLAPHHIGMMTRATYRSYADYDVLVAIFPINMGEGVGGLMWVELRGLLGDSLAPGSWFTFRYGKAAWDGRNRWLGSVAMDRVGYVALGYSSVDAGRGVYPSLYYRGGNEYSDPEVLLVNGTTASSMSFFGGRSAMGVDPVDGCSFYFLGPLVTQSSAPTTYIGQMHFPRCKDTAECLHDKDCNDGSVCTRDICRDGKCLSMMDQFYCGYGQYCNTISGSCEAAT